MNKWKTNNQRSQKIGAIFKKATKTDAPVVSKVQQREILGRPERVEGEDPDGERIMEWQELVLMV